MDTVTHSKIYVWVGTFAEGWICQDGGLTSDPERARRFSAESVKTLLRRKSWVEGTSAQTGRTTYRLDAC